jgi:hypothetical protein
MDYESIFLFYRVVHKRTNVVLMNFEKTWTTSEEWANLWGPSEFQIMFSAKIRQWQNKKSTSSKCIGCRRLDVVVILVVESIPTYWRDTRSFLWLLLVGYGRRSMDSWVGQRLPSLSVRLQETCALFNSALLFITLVTTLVNHKL